MVYLKFVEFNGKISRKLFQLLSTLTREIAGSLLTNSIMGHRKKTFDFILQSLIARDISGDCMI